MEIQPRIRTSIDELEKITLTVNCLGLFSSNELIDDVPTDSLSFLLLPCYLGVLHQNITTEPKVKLAELERATIYYQSFLERARNLKIIDYNFHWDVEAEEEKLDGERRSKLTAEQARSLKLARFRKKKELTELESSIRHQIQTSDSEDSILRHLYVTQLKYWCEKSLEELQSIEEETPLLKMMAERGSTPMEPRPPRIASKPFIITRDEQQKKVFGIGYPAIPTMTVDQWYEKRFGHGQQASAPSSSAPRKDDSEEDENDDESRQRKIRMDEYKDTHRRGWGNTHNKG
ncbi:unnamed protein product [Caenorhabditis auriculariae]|uniref:Immunoglobulin-binding protein 1 n=1 Tax=Caenorhabditis auriculariae TaxID=2777116 RepID=A0A8S1GYI0_9PELO|nr:unnamed protein product [Caenorhabditis auriculariae]